MLIFGRLTYVIVLIIFNSNHINSQNARRLDVIITEVFPDPTPSFGMPAFEFVEIQNKSSTPFNLKDWKLSDGGTVGTITTNIILYPDSFIIICPTTAVTLFKSFGAAVGISNFPSLDNDGDLVVLFSSQGSVIHAIGYNKQWYQNDLKSNGGWSLEMMDTNNPCSGNNNWTASQNSDGGTPGKKNSSNTTNMDDMPPFLVRSYAIDENTLSLVFDEPLDSLSAAIASKYSLGNRLNQPDNAIPVAPLFTEVHVRFRLPLIEETTYEVTVAGVTDCRGNEITTNSTVKAGRFSEPDTADLVINEILFNPNREGFDFVELYNKSKKIINLEDLFLSNRNSAGNLANVVQLSTHSHSFYPGEYFVFTENKTWLEQHYSAMDPAHIMQVSSLPSMPDDFGTAVLTSINGRTLEQIRYDSKWHFALLNEVEGISLERIDFSTPVQDKNNWTSAASTAGFATPGYQNSQFRSDIQTQGQIRIDPQLFSPDNDGRDDIATIHYEMASAGFVCNIIIFDVNGRPVKHLAKNSTLGVRGNFRWDGLDDHSQRLPIGVYIVFTEIFNLNGKTKKFKNVLTLAREF